MFDDCFNKFWACFNDGFNDFNCTSAHLPRGVVIILGGLLLIFSKVTAPVFDLLFLAHVFVIVVRIVRIVLKQLNGVRKKTWNVHRHFARALADDGMNRVHASLRQLVVKI